MRRPWFLFAAGLVAGAVLCLGCQWLARWSPGKAIVPDTATNLALTWETAIEADPALATQYWSAGRRQSVTTAMLSRLAGLAKSAPGTGIERYVALRFGQSGDPNAQLVLLRAIEPGQIGNRYWEIEDVLLFPAADFDSHILSDGSAPD